jgi:hypothetical protein
MYSLWALRNVLSYVGSNVSNRPAASIFGVSDLTLEAERPPKFLCKSTNGTVRHPIAYLALSKLRVTILYENIKNQKIHWEGFLSPPLHKQVLGHLVKSLRNAQFGLKLATTFRASSVAWNTLSNRSINSDQPFIPKEPATSVILVTFLFRQTLSIIHLLIALNVFSDNAIRFVSDAITHFENDT